MSWSWVLVDLWDEVGSIGGLFPSASKGLAFMFFLEDGLGGVLVGGGAVVVIAGEV